MLGRKTYTREELDHAKAMIAEQLAAHAALVEAVAGAGKGEKEIRSALGTFEAVLFNSLVLALDRPFVHRVRPVAGKDGNPLNEVEMICDSLMHDGVFRSSTVIKLDPEQSVLKLSFGDTIRLTASQFQRLSTAFFAELERKFL